MAHITTLLTILALGVVVAQGDLTSTEVTKRADLRIIRGHNAQLGQFPWQALVKCFRSSIISNGCGGSLISTRHILTAAHCLDSAVLCQVSLGLTSSTKVEYSYFVHHNDMIIHKKSIFNNYFHDIAIIRLRSPIRLTENIQPIRLAKEYQNSRRLSGVSAVISGWGKTRDDENGLHNLLQYAKGDSGGPLAILEADNKWTLIGVVSLGAIPCEEGMPSVFTAVASYLSWINQNTKN